jgi:hypothetical protein
MSLEENIVAAHSTFANPYNPKPPPTLKVRYAPGQGSSAVLRTKPQPLAGNQTATRACRSAHTYSSKIMFNKRIHFHSTTEDGEQDVVFKTQQAVLF